MTDSIKTLPLIDSLDRERVKIQLMYHNAFKQLKKARKQYNITTNECLVLNGVFLYVFLVKADFTIDGITKFVSYYNKKLIKYYINKLIGRGYIVIHRTAGRNVYYRLASQAYEVITTIFDDYDKRQREFCEKFNIML